MADNSLSLGEGGPGLTLTPSQQFDSSVGLSDFLSSPSFLPVSSPNGLSSSQFDFSVQPSTITSSNQSGPSQQPAPRNDSPSSTDAGATGAGGSSAAADAKRKKACYHCRKNKSACVGGRPCARCIRVGKKDSCVDDVEGSDLPPPPPRKRAPKPKDPTATASAPKPNRKRVAKPSTPLLSSIPPSLLTEPAPSSSLALTTAEPEPQSPSVPTVEPSTLTQTVDPSLIPHWLRVSDAFAMQTAALHVTASNYSPTRQMISAMAWIVHNTGHLMEDFCQKLGAKSRLCCVCVAHSKRIRPSRSRTSLLLDSPHSSRDESLDSKLDGFSRSKPSSLFGPSREVALDPLHAATDFLALSDRRETSLMGLMPSGGASSDRSGVAVFIPYFGQPPHATAAETQYYEILNSWLHLPAVRTQLQSFFSQLQPYAVDVQFRAEQLLCRSLPFAALICPIYPNPFSYYPSWANARMAELLGYEPKDLESIPTLEDFFRLFFLPSLEALYAAFRECIVSGTRSKTFRLTFLHKSGRPIQTITSLAIRFYECMPMVGVIYCQQYEPPAVPLIPFQMPINQPFQHSAPGGFPGFPQGMPPGPLSMSITNMSHNPQMNQLALLQSLLQ